MNDGVPSWTPPPTQMRNVLWCVVIHRRLLSQCLCNINIEDRMDNHYVNHIHSNENHVQAVDICTERSQSHMQKCVHVRTFASTKKLVTCKRPRHACMHVRFRSHPPPRLAIRRGLLAAPCWKKKPVRNNRNMGTLKRPSSAVLLLLAALALALGKCGKSNRVYVHALSNSTVFRLLHWSSEQN